MTTENGQPIDSEDPLYDPEVEDFGWSFHKWPFLISVAIVVVLYLLIFVFVDEFPPYFDPAKLPPPPK